MNLNQRLFRLAAELGDLHLHRRRPARELAEIDAIIAAKMAETDAIKALMTDADAEQRAAAAAAAQPPSLPDVPEPKEGAAHAAAPSIDAAPDRPAAE
jgi:hypothetical protein